VLATVSPKLVERRLPAGTDHGALYGVSFAVEGKLRRKAFAPPLDLLYF
jgi:hypothetical protein